MLLIEDTVFFPSQRYTANQVGTISTVKAQDGITKIHSYLDILTPVALLTICTLIAPLQALATMAVHSVFRV